jgi:hypothetical protein
MADSRAMARLVVALLTAGLASSCDAGERGKATPVKTEQAPAPPMRMIGAGDRPNLPPDISPDMIQRLNGQQIAGAISGSVLIRFSKSGARILSENEWFYPNGRWNWSRGLNQDGEIKSGSWSTYHDKLCITVFIYKIKSSLLCRNVWSVKSENSIIMSQVDDVDGRSDLSSFTVHSFDR